MNLYFAAFLIIPVIALAAKESGTLKLAIWFVFVIYVVLGCLLVNLALDASQRDLDEIVRNTLNPSDKLLNEWQSGDTARVFASYFGWIYSSVYFYVCYCAVKLGTVIIQVSKSK